MAESTSTSGTLYVVATPIGNLEDITFRALRVLREVNLIACEDTRQTRKLLQHYSIATRLVSYHDWNEQERALELIQKLQDGESIALVSDAGTPLIADPGYRIVHAARQAKIAVAPVPGPSASLAALSASGLPTDTYVFGGFLPARQTQRRKRLQELGALEATLVFYETPHRLLEALEDIESALGDRRVVLGRELTKIFEEFLDGTPRRLLEILAKRPSLKGEFVLMIEKGALPLTDDEATLEQSLAKCLERGMPRMDAIKEAARRHGLSKREAYHRLQLNS